MSSVEVVSETFEDYVWSCSQCGSVVRTRLSNSPTPVEIHDSGVEFNCNQALVNSVHRL